VLPLGDGGGRRPSASHVDLFGGWGLAVGCRARCLAWWPGPGHQAV